MKSESVMDNDAVLEDENLLSPEDSPTHDPQWETIETMVINGDQRYHLATKTDILLMNIHIFCITFFSEV